jgi:hypothetical protein
MFVCSLASRQRRFKPGMFALQKCNTAIHGTSPWREGDAGFELRQEAQQVLLMQVS